MIRVNISLRWIIFLSFIVSTLLGASMVGILAIRAGSDSLDLVNRELRREINLRVSEHLEDFFQIPRQIIEGNTNRILRNDLDVFDQELLIENFLWQVELFPSVSSIYFGNSLGGIANAGREGTGGFLYRIRTQGFEAGEFTKRPVVTTTESIPALLTLPNFDARQRPWYRNALSTDGPVWSNPYRLFTGQDIAITASAPVRTPEGEYLGILAVDLFLSDLSVYLQGLHEEEIRQCIILGPGGEIIASSTGEAAFVQDAQENFQPASARESEDLLTRLVAQKLPEGHQQVEDVIYFENRRYYVEASPLQYPEGLGWTIATLMPEHEIFEVVLAGIRTALFILSALLLLVFLVSSYIAKKISSPLSRLTLIAQSLAEGDWSIDFIDPSRIREIGILSNSFYQMLQRLQETIENLTEEIAERKAIQAELVIAKDQALEASKIKSQFVANMSHELRTPLNAVLGFTELLGDFPMEDEQRSYLELAQRAGTNLMTLIGDILDFSKIEAGMVDLKIGPTDLIRVIDDTIALLSVTAGEKGIDFWVEYYQDLPATIWVDSERLQQILINLLNNGIKFTPSGSVILGIGFLPGPNDRGLVSFAVEDTGVGIAEDQLSKLFKPFSQVDSTQTRAHGGTGLGLLISQLLVQAMGSDIDVSSSPGNGSRFAFNLDVRYEDDQKPNRTPSKTTEIKHPLPFEDSITDHPPRILLAEDVEMNRVLIRAMVNKIYSQVELIYAADGAAAVQEFSLQSPDIILMDVQMPNMDGKDATRAIRQLESKTGTRVPIIALTASATAFEQQECFLSGMDDFLAKPVYFQSLQEKILFWVGQGTKKAPDSTP